MVEQGIRACVVAGTSCAVLGSDNRAQRFHGAHPPAGLRKWGRISSFEGPECEPVRTAALETATQGRTRSTAPVDAAPILFASCHSVRAREELSGDDGRAPVLGQKQLEYQVL